MKKKKLTAPEPFWKVVAPKVVAPAQPMPPVRKFDTERKGFIHKFSIYASAPEVPRYVSVKQDLSWLEAQPVCLERDRILAMLRDIEIVSDGRYKGYLTVGLFDDGTVGEIFVLLDKVGSSFRGFIDAWAIQVSKRLQEGVDLADIVRTHRGAKFEPAGRTDTPGLRTCTSPIDYIVRYLEHRYINKLPLKD